MNGSVEVEVSISNGGDLSDSTMRSPEWTESSGYFTFHYFLPPTIMGLEPSLGPATGGTRLRVTAGYTDTLLAVNTYFRAIDLNPVYTALPSPIYTPYCKSPKTRVNGECQGMFTFGSYTDYGPMTPGLESYCVFEPHCRCQLDPLNPARKPSQPSP